jgi:hypothetical protein
MEQARRSTSRAHSESFEALRALKLMPMVPNFAALEDCGAPL